ncbi:hypothetical protein ABE10_03300 [Bacillus toyonensis]|nr:hypothetical protein [Bacillus toyonensis]
MRDPEGVAEVLDGEVPVLLRLLQEGDARRLRDEAAGREVVDLQTLLEEVGVVGRRRVAEEAVRHRLQRHRPQPVTAGDGGGREIDPAVLHIGDRPGRVREVVDVQELEAQLLGHDAHGPVRERPRAVPCGLELLLCQLLDLRQVVVVLAHPHAELGVGAACLLRRRDRLAFATMQLTMQAENRLDRLV